LAKRRLFSHPDSPEAPFDLGAKVTLVGSDVLKIEYVVIGRISDIRLPAPALPERKDELWQHSCFEAFVGLGDARAYVEFNFSPSGEWASYRFEAHRRGRQPAMNLPSPDIYREQADDGRFALTAWLDLARLAREVPSTLGLSAVIEDKTGAISYWALAHPPGEPDFHHADCFALELPAATGA
jgi:hypothetical protein